MRNLNKRAFPIQTIATRHRVPLPPSDTSPTDFDLIAALLPPSASSATTVSDEHDDDDDDEHRTATLLLLRLAYAQSHAQLASIAQELELLRGAPPAPPLPPQPGTSERARSSPEADRALWTLDAPRSVGTSQRGGQLLDSVGKVCGPGCRFSFDILAHGNVRMQPLQPFTILPSSAGSDRARLREQVFQPDHRLPTMTIDEYLEIERQRGNILTGGG